MRKIKRFSFQNLQMLDCNDMQNLTGGVSGAAVCNEGNSCTFLFVPLNEYIAGTCVQYVKDTTFNCYCQGKNFSGASNACLKVV